MTYIKIKLSVFEYTAHLTNTLNFLMSVRLERMEILGVQPL